ncbi:hypothetical protein JGI3_01791 [Candidatus Kryptobacter tengchongensis]|uniref:Uncharacterized protein n=1 Tax=Kryptobacter tengchongensis TaxID=1643429 RepID=A0A656D3I2_KRYT1|nr:hypothetical protein [Candidatus Kryptobacter tengchongensis]CUS77039.1 hypothetical protein JGI20_01647 [Candidatus Kryptobacter tengchongensis]CUS98311.1 hypothetical protein JGI24_00429 [Candidatus Kryptobacter tengchongensis]CUS98484.1 hypothetical protein JGI25_00424 [Candidatus Kryptobacter tengchongensis]CUS99927.1 hypothetical protein JGI22_00477 [Candidatus Kryptobacter tengchongensis]CUU00924.1 hypothetical protein JGI2_00657 [Candidatus Kryptobacter tengchongensis]
MNSDTIIWGLIIPFGIFTVSFVITYMLYKKFSKELGANDKHTS